MGISRIRRVTGLAMLAVSGMASSAWAGAGAGYIEYAPLGDGAVGVASVPTLGEWSLIVMALLMAAVAYRVLRKRVNGRLLSNLLVVGTLAGLAGYTGHLNNRYSEAHALSAELRIDLDNPAGDQAAIGLPNEVYLVTNTSEVTQRITAIEAVDEDVSVGDVASQGSYDPSCVVGLELNGGDTCYVFLEKEEDEDVGLEH